MTHTSEYVMSEYEKKYHAICIPDTLFQLVDNPFDVLLIEGMIEDNILILKYQNLSTFSKVKNSASFNDNHESFIKTTFHENFATLTFTNKIWLVKFKSLFESYKASLS